MRSEEFFIRIVYNDSTDGFIKYSSFKLYNTLDEISIINNTIKQAVCYEGINDVFYKKSLSVMKANGTSGWNIAGGPYVVTNHHVAGGVGSKRHTLVYNYESPTCQPVENANNTLRIQTNGVIASGEKGGDQDWYLYEVDEITWEEAGISPIFGALTIETQNNNQLIGMPVFIAQHPWGI